MKYFSNVESKEQHMAFIDGGNTDLRTYDIKYIENEAPNPAFGTL